jgi:hypothetical protein
MGHFGNTISDDRLAPQDRAGYVPSRNDYLTNNSWDNHFCVTNCEAVYQSSAYVEYAVLSFCCRRVSKSFHAQAAADILH